MTIGGDLEFWEKVVSIAIGAIPTYLAVRGFYERRHRETLQRFADGERKAYAAERDFNHLRTNQENISQAIKLLDKELQDTREDFLEIKGMLMVTLNQIGVSESGIFAHRKKDERQ